MRIMQSSNTPIYRQIADQLKNDILSGRMKEGTYLPSIRELARDLKVSVITTMKAYEDLEQEGLVTAVQGKGFFVNAQDTEMLKEQHLRKVEDALTEAIRFSEAAGLTDKELVSTLRTLQELRRTEG